VFIVSCFFLWNFLCWFFREQSSTKLCTL